MALSWWIAILAFINLSSVNLSVYTKEVEMKRISPDSSVVVACFITIVIAVALPVYGGQFESFIPQLIDLKGWQADDADGMDMDMGATKMIQAMRMYSQGEKELGAMVMVGNAMMAQMQATQAMKAETKDAEVEIKTIDGFQVSLNRLKGADEGAVIVVLGGNEQQAATFLLHYKGLKQKDALTYTKKFDWKKLQQTAAKLMK